MNKYFGILALAPVLAWANMSQDLVVNKGYVRATPPGSMNTAAYMVLSNKGMDAITIMGVSSSEAAEAQVHDMAMNNNMMHMEQLKTLDIQPGGRIELAPGGMHIMLMDLKSPTRPGQEFPLTFIMQDGSEEKVVLPVRGVGNPPQP